MDSDSMGTPIDARDCVVEEKRGFAQVFGQDVDHVERKNDVSTFVVVVGGEVHFGPGIFKDLSDKTGVNPFETVQNAAQLSLVSL